LEEVDEDSRKLTPAFKKSDWKLSIGYVTENRGQWWAVLNAVTNFPRAALEKLI
jgi:hypothetical protein